MREQFDKKLSDKIKSTFKGHQEPDDANEWEKFSQQYFKTSPPKGMIWVKSLSGVAAAVLLGILIYIWDNQSQQPSLLAEKSSETTVEIQSEKSIDENSNSSKEYENYGTILKSNIKELGDSSIPDISGDSMNTKSIIAKNGKEKSKPNTQIKKEPLEDLTNYKNDAMGETIIALDHKPIKEIDLGTENKEISEQEALKEIEKWLSETKDSSENHIVIKPAQYKEPIKLGVLVAPQTISNSTKSINLGAGVMSEISLSRKVKFDVGVAFASQQISPTSNPSAMESSPDLSNSNTNALDLRVAYFTGNFLNSTRELSFGLLEIPLNLKYKVLDKKESDLYMISGISNMFYLNQRDVTTFKTANIATSGFLNSQQMVNTSTQTVKPENNSGIVDTGRMLNIGFGFEQHLKNGTFLSLEPYYKMPLGNQTFTNQQFSIGGINLRMNFQLKNK